MTLEHGPIKIQAIPLTARGRLNAKIHNRNREKPARNVLIGATYSHCSACRIPEPTEADLQDAYEMLTGGRYQLTAVDQDYFGNGEGSRGSSLSLAH